MNTNYFLTALLLSAAATQTAASTQFLKRAATRGGDATLFLRASTMPLAPTSAAARTLRTLDTNHDGLVEPSEVSAFAQLQGLDVAAATKEYAGVDLNGDGNLDANELSLALDSSTSDHSAEKNEVADHDQQNEQPQQPPKQQEVSVATNQELPLLAKNTIYTATDGAEKAASLAAAAAAIDVVHPSPQVVPGTALTSTAATQKSSARARAEAARKMMKQITIEEERTLEADALEQNASDIRTSSSRIAQKFARQAAEASSKAAKAKANDILAEVTQLEDKARSAEVKAAQLRTSLKADLLEANEQMGIASAALSAANMTSQ